MAVKSLLLMAIAGLAISQPFGHGIISGTVIDSASGDPVRKAVVTVTWQGKPRSWATAQTDGSGNFKFDGLPSGKYDLRARKAGVGTAIYGAASGRELGDFVKLNDGETASGLKLRFLHFATISGRVFDPDGDPIPNVNVNLLRPGRNLGVRVLTNTEAASTDDRGEYRISGILPGEYYMRSDPVRRMISGVFGVGTRLRKPAGVSPPMVLGVFYGGSRLSKDAVPLTIRDGDSLTGIDFHLISEPAAQLIGHVIGAPEPAASGAAEATPFGPHPESVQVQLWSLDDDRSFGQTTGASGSSFEVQGVAAGRYRLRAVMRSTNKVFATNQIVDLHPGLNEMDVALSPGIDLKGQIHFEGPPSPEAGRPQVVLSRPGVRGEAFRASPRTDGQFTLIQVIPGEWEIDVAGLPRGSFLKSARLGDKDILFTNFELASADVPLQIVVSTNTSIVEGEVDSQGANPARAGIVLAPVGKLHQFARFYYGAPADDQGKFKLEGLAPGKYKIYALEKMAALGFRNPDAVDKLESLGEEIELTEGKTLEVHPKLIPQARAREALP